MKSRNNELSRTPKSKSLQGQGPNWVLIAGGALLTTLSIRLGYKFKQALDVDRKENASTLMKGDARCASRKKVAGSHLHTNLYPHTQDYDDCSNVSSAFGKGDERAAGMRHPENGHMCVERYEGLSLVTVPPADFNKDSVAVWTSSPDRLELPPKPFHQSSPDSPSISESGSDNISKREVVYKLRQQLKRRDEMILEMQGQIVGLQNSLNAELVHASHLQMQCDAANKDLMDSEREIQRLRKTIAHQCLSGPAGFTASAEAQNGHLNGCLNQECNYELLTKGRAGDERIEMLEKKTGELKEVLEGKDYLVQSYKEQKAELLVKVRGLQQRLDTELVNTL